MCIDTWFTVKLLKLCLRFCTAKEPIYKWDFLAQPTNPVGEGLAR